METEDMTLAELLKKTTEENQTRKILDIIEDCENLEETIEKVKDMLNNIS